VNAEDLGHYYMTSKSSPDSWLDKAEALIRGHGGKVLARAFSQAEGRAAYLLGFELEGQRYKIVWPVLSTKKSIEAARVQAVTLMYHDIKARILTAKVLGNRVAFFAYLLLPDGRTTAQVADPELATTLPDLNRPLLGPGN
jgi:hypothetical protein